MQLLNRRRCVVGLAASLVATQGPVAWAKDGQQRIVSVGGALTETLFALGAQADLVGADTTSLHPEAARRLPSVGYARALSAEGLLSLRPSLVVATKDAGPLPVLRQLEAARVRLVLLDADHRFEGVLARTRRLAELCGRGAAGQTLAAQMQQGWQAAQASVEAAVQVRQRSQGSPGSPGSPGSTGTRPKVLFVLSHSMAQVRVSGRDTAADAMLAYAGAANALTSFDGYKPLTPEAAIAAAPDIILATDQGLQAAGGIDGLLAAPGLAQTPAGRARRVVAQDALLMLGFGPRLPQAVAALARALHSAG
jgi:iron complex transport system substrate-binding protein